MPSVIARGMGRLKRRHRLSKKTIIKASNQERRKGMEQVDAKRVLTLWNWVVIFCKGKFGGGLPAVLEYILDIFNEKVLRKVSPENLKKYSALVVALAEFGEKVLNIYIMDEGKKEALTKTVDTLRNLATALEDGKVTPDEMEQAIQDVTDTINAWKNITTISVA